jgi:acyl-CoA thioester hydrolase
MDRVRISMPDSYSFTTSIAVRITDINYGGHVGNDSFLSLIHEARVQYLAKWNYTELNVERVGLIMADMQIEFKKELAYKDIVHIHISALNFDKLGFDIFYLLEVEQNGVMVVAGKAKTGMMCFNYQEKKKTSLPLKALENLQGK